MRELDARLDSRELTAWAVWEARYGPLGPERFDRLFAVLASVIANSNRGKGQKAYQPDQFLPPEWLQSARPDPTDPAAREELSGEDLLAKVKSMHRNMGGR